MIKKLTIFALLSVSGSALSADIEYGLGFGSQYGNLGGQIAIKNDHQKYYVALGFAGAGLEFQSAFGQNKQYSWGADVAKFQGIFYDNDTKLVSLNFNYHFNGFDNGGWELGPSVVYYSEDDHKPLSLNIRTATTE